MRITTKLATGLMGVGVLAVSYKLGLPTATATPLANTDGTTTSLTSDPVTTPAPAASATPSASAAPSKAPAASGGTTSKPKATKKPSATGSSSSSSGGNTNPPPAATSKTKTGDAINYRFGTVQVSVTEDANGKITAVDMVQAGATGGRDGAFPALQQAAISAQGSSFGNVSRATFTTQAFKNALDSALAKF